MTQPARTVSGRLLASYVVVLTAFAVTLGWSLNALRGAARDAQTLRAIYVPLSLSIGDALAEQNVMNTQLNHVTSAKNPSDVQQWMETAQRLRPATFHRIRAAAETGSVGGDPGRTLRTQVVAETRALEAELVRPDETRALFQHLSSGRRAEAERVRDAMLARETEAAGRLRALRKRVDEEMKSVTRAAEERERRSILLLIGLSILTLLVGLLSSVHARRVLTPLSAMTQRARAVADGDLSPREVVASPDEIGELAVTFEAMVEAIRSARAELVQAERLATIGKMAAHITHEIRNPLSSIGLNLELLEEEVAALEGASPEEALALTAAIKGELDRLTRTAQQYLSAAREPQLHVAREDLVDLVTECHTFLRPEIEQAGLRTRIEIEGDVPELDVDESQLRQALVNLIRNAREASSEGGELIVRVTAEDDGGASIAVEDDGPGVPKEERATIFEPFRTTKAGGTGLGLAITRSIVTSHGGDIACVESPSGGAAFRVRLPGPSSSRP